MTLNWITWFGASSVQPVVQAFEKVDPDIHVNIESFPLNEYIPKVVADMTAKSSAVDILSVDAPEVAEYTTRHYVLPLNKYFTQAELNSSIAAAPLSSSYYQGVSRRRPSRARATSFTTTRASSPLINCPTEPHGTLDLVGHSPGRPTADGTLRRHDQGVGAGLRAGHRSLRDAAPTRIARCKPLELLVQGLVAGHAVLLQLFNVWKISANLNAPTVTSEADSLFETGHIAMMTGGEWDAVGFAAAKASFNFAPYPKFAGGKWVVPDRRASPRGGHLQRPCGSGRGVH